MRDPAGNRDSAHITKYGHVPERAENRRCRLCAQERNRKYRASHPDRDREYREANPEQVRRAKAAWVAANPDRARAYGRKWAAANSEKCAASLRAWRVANPDKTKEQWRRYRESNPEKRAESFHRRRARQLNATGSHTAADVKAQYAAQRGKCYWCKKRVGNRYHVDHVIPLARGGSNGRDNIVVACAACNHRKGAKMPDAFAGVLL